MNKITITLMLNTREIGKQTPFEAYEQHYLFKLYGENRKCKCGGKLVIKKNQLFGCDDIECENESSYMKSHQYVHDGKIYDHDTIWNFMNYDFSCSLKEFKHFEISINNKRWGF